MTVGNSEQSKTNKSSEPKGSEDINIHNNNYIIDKIKHIFSHFFREKKQQAGVSSSSQKIAPKTKRRSRGAHNPLIVFANFMFMLAAFCLICGGGLLYIGKTILHHPGKNSQAQAVSIPAGAGINTIADLLKKQELIANAQFFIYGCQWEGKVNRLKAGEYEIPAYASMQDIINILVRGRSVQYSITFPEGLTVQQIFTKIQQNPLLTGDLPQDLPPEGSLMTDTVKFTRGTARREIIARLKEGQSHLVREIWENRDSDLPLKTPEDMVILASIVEKETGLAAERPKVAAVFYNRLKKNMRLQSDPTVLYGLFGGKGRPADRPIYRSDLETATPFNTYKITGLPPAPICNPGKDSLLAVAHPPQTNDLYFVANGSGGHVFSQTLSEHNNNVSKWRALRKAKENADKNAAVNADKTDGGMNPAGSAQSSPAFQPLPYSEKTSHLPLLRDGSSVFEQDGLIKEQP